MHVPQQMNAAACYAPVYREKKNDLETSMTEADL